MNRWHGVRCTGGRLTCPLRSQDNLRAGKLDGRVVLGHALADSVEAAGVARAHRVALVLVQH